MPVLLAFTRNCLWNTGIKWKLSLCLTVYPFAAGVGPSGHVTHPSHFTVETKTQRQVTCPRSHLESLGKVSFPLFFM